MSQANPTSRPRRRRWALGLRGWMMLVLVVGGTLGWQLTRMRTRHLAVAQLRAAGADVIYDYQAPEGQPYQMGASPPGPRWLRQLVGDEPFRRAKHVLIDGRGPKGDEPTAGTVSALAALDAIEQLHLYKSPWTDDQFDQIANLSALKTATLLDTRLTPASLPRLLALPRLESLAVRFDRETLATAVLPGLARNPRLKVLVLLGLKFSGPGDLSGLGSLPNLESLRIHESPADEACLEPLLTLSRLTSLDMLTTRITDAGLRRLTRLTKLEMLQLEGTAVTDEGLAVVCQWPNLQALTLANCRAPETPGRVTDRGLEHFAGLSRLNHLTLAGARITDAGLASLARLPRLEQLSLAGVEATEAGLRDLLAAHQLRGLSLAGPSVSDHWTAKLIGQPRLESVTLVGPHLTDAAIAGLPMLPKLRILCMPGAEITDKALEMLAESPLPLTCLDLRGTGVTDAGIGRLRATKPGVEVIAGPIDPRP